MSARSRSTTSSIGYYGEGTCQRTEECEKKAYYWSKGQAVCGAHSRSDGSRSALPKNPNKDKIEEERIMSLIEAAEESAKAHSNMRGRVGLRRIGMMKPTPMVAGYYTVLPNARAKSKGGLVLAYPELSPKNLGPVVHGQPELPECANLENFHQFNKVFKSEVNEATGERIEAWFERRRKGYKDTEAHRHKLAASKSEHLRKAGKGAKGNSCLYSVFVKPDGQEMKCDYIQSRVFYCSFYDRLARETQAIQKLVDNIYVHNRSILIAGYDAKNEDDVTPEQIAEWYFDPSHPFGHELALVAILLHWHDPEELPWRKEAKKLDFEF